MKALSLAESKETNEALTTLLDSCTERQGWLILRRDGSIRNSSGDLKDRADIGKTMLAMLRDAGDLLGSAEEANFRRMCISYESYQYAVQLAPDSEDIVIVKDKK
jgi:hypothetical protein